MMRRRAIQFRCGQRRGAIFVLALAVIVILSGLLLVFAQQMRVESLASANRLSYVQADAIEQGAEQWVLAQVESYAPDSVTITETNAEALPVAGGYFWVLHPDPTQDQTYQFGITDECGKVNINSAVGTGMQLINLPGMTNDIVTAIGDWVNPAGGSTSDYYSSLQEPYRGKGGVFESVPELLLLDEMTPQILYGFDLNHDGILDDNERALAGTGAQFSMGSTTTDTRGLYNYVTCFSAKAPSGSTSSASTGTTTGTNGTTTATQIVNVTTPGLSGLQQVLTTAIPSRGAAIWSSLTGSGSPPSYPSLSAFYQAAQRGGITASDYGLIADQVTSGASQQLLNVNTASEQALMCLPTLTQSDADAVIAARSNADTSNMSWFFNAIPSKIGSVVDWVTDRSYQYSADIVAVSGDGRAYKRVFIVVDASNYPTTPAKIVYRKDLTSLGWPLPPTFRDSLRTGQGAPDATSTSGTLQMNVTR